jgi:hypothetical protein
MHHSLADTLPAPAPVKTCGCGRAYDADGWARLPVVGVIVDEGGVLQLRNCECRSTLAVSMCIVRGCGERATWTADDSLEDYCEHHAHAWLMAESRSEFAEECARAMSGAA